MEDRFGSVLSFFHSFLLVGVVGCWLFLVVLFHILLHFFFSFIFSVSAFSFVDSIVPAGFVSASRIPVMC